MPNYKNTRLNYPTQKHKLMMTMTLGLSKDVMNDELFVTENKMNANGRVPWEFLL